ncbi:hypothetical protein BDP27DRAFT_1375600 [Rhodocollybia butyracea]|uniref:Uncharacterized protein n=1 Tax=Rhodocollybia butyracea TaxID=206335 RepID=A0A9P5P472_9AGAR|nr:hypothetical protein BDP27DRAFT_1375600 [Rhodocollybia butyracea]
MLCGLLRKILRQVLRSAFLPTDCWFSSLPSRHFLLSPAAGSAHSSRTAFYRNISSQRSSQKSISLLFVLLPALLPHNNPTHNNPTHNNPTHNNPTHNNPTHNNPTHNNPTHNNPTHNNPTDNNHGKGNHDWTKELKFTDEHDPKVPEKPDDPKQIAYFWFAGGKLCSGYTNCLAYVVVTEGHVPGTTMTVGAVIVVTMDDPQSVTFTVYDHIPSNEREHEDSIEKHQEKYYEFLTTFTYKEEGKVWIEQMADKRDKVLISERLRATLLRAIPLCELINLSPTKFWTTISTSGACNTSLSASFKLGVE